MARVREGDRAAFEALYERYAPPVMAFLHGLSADRHLAEDLVQETFLRAWRAAPRWRPEARVSTWLLQIAKRLAWKRLRRRGRRPTIERQAEERRPRSVAPDAGLRLVQADEVRRIEAALDTVRPRLRAVFVLVRLMDRPYAEVAEILGIPVGTAKSRMAAAEAKLRKRLEG